MTKTMSEESTLFGYIGEILNYKANPLLPITSKDMDDCALIKISETHSMAVTSDFVRGTGFTLFKLGLMNHFDAGYYLITANISDLASTGAKPIGLTTVIRYSDEMDDDNFKNVFQGMKAAADIHGAQIIGGDVGSYNADVFVATAFGMVETNKALLRKNVQMDDLLCVTGVVGRAATAMSYFREVKKMGFNLSDTEEKEILDAWRRPQARVKEGLLLSERQLANGCQDVSDGLKASIEQLSKICGKTFTLHADKVPMHPITIKMAEFLGIDPLQIAISASVDFELMFTIPRAKQEDCLRVFAEHDLTMSVIGEVNAENWNYVLDQNDEKKELPGVSWNQQKGDFIKEIIKK